MVSCQLDRAFSGALCYVSGCFSGNNNLDGELAERDAGSMWRSAACARQASDRLRLVAFLLQEARWVLCFQKHVGQHHDPSVTSSGAGMYRWHVGGRLPESCRSVATTQDMRWGLAGRKAQRTPVNTPLCVLCTSHELLQACRLRSVATQGVIPRLATLYPRLYPAASPLQCYLCRGLLCAVYKQILC